jgi:hypothetical protein
MTHWRRTVRLRSLIAVCTLALALRPLTPLPTAQAASASSIVVSTCDQSDLQSAIDQANSDNAGDIITFSCSGDIALDTNLDIEGSMTLDGSNQAVTLDGNSMTQVVVVDSAVNVTLKNLTIANGNKQQFQGSGGGGIANYGGTLSVINSILSHNVGGGGFGGGIYSRSGTVKVTNSTLSGNTGSSGGGIYNLGTLDVTNSVIISNTAAAFSGEGGGIYSQGTTTVTNSSISGNRTIAGDGDGGGITNLNGKLTVANSTISANSVQGGQNGTGAGIFTTGSATVTNSTFSGNASSGDGGGIWNGQGGTATVTNSTFSANRVSANGGGIANSATMVLANSILANEPSSKNCFNNGTLTNSGGNLADDATCGATQVTTASLKLAALANNGGPTQTIALGSGSTAINAGISKVCNAAPVGGMDQRGAPRTADGCDSGAMEVTLPGVSIAVTASAKAVQQLPGTGLISPPIVLTATVTLTNSAVLSVPSGTVQFKVDGFARGAPVTLVNGIAASAKISALTAGTHTATAIYTGTPIFPSVTGTLSLVVRATL